MPERDQTERHHQPIDEAAAEAARAPRAADAPLAVPLGVGSPVAIQPPSKGDLFDQADSVLPLILNEQQQAVGHPRTLADRSLEPSDTAPSADVAQPSEAPIASPVLDPPHHVDSNIPRSSPSTEETYQATRRVLGTENATDTRGACALDHPSLLVEPLDRISRSVDPLTKAVNGVGEKIEGRRDGRGLMLAKILLIAVPAMWAYENYLERQLESRVIQSETEFSNITQQLTSDSPAIRSNAIRNLYQLAFRDFLPEGTTGPLAPPVNLTTWLAGKRDHRFLERSRRLFQEYAAQPRPDAKTPEDIVSTTFLKTAIEWRGKEVKIFKKSVRDADLWLLRSANLRSAYGPGLSLAAMNLSGTDLTNARFPSARLAECNLQGAIVAGAYFENAILDSVNLQVKNGTKAHFSFASLKNVIANQAQLVGADFTLANLSDSRFDGANLETAVFRTTTLHKTSFIGANLRGANFSNADLEGADLSEAEIAGADFRFAVNLDRVSSWRGAKNPKDAQFPKGFVIP